MFSLKEFLIGEKNITIIIRKIFFQIGKPMRIKEQPLVEMGGMKIGFHMKHFK
jgi:hypothetical protein